MLAIGCSISLRYHKHQTFTMRNHIFWVDSSNPTTVYTKVSDGYEPEMIDSKCSKVVADRNREQELSRYVLKQVAAPGLKEIKQVELYSKF
jgi:hypothetical protein